MDPVASAVLRSWEWRPSVLIVLGALGVLYAVGWWRLRRRTAVARARHPAPRHRRRLDAPWRLVAYWAGLLLIGLALLSPIDTLASLLFIMHMFQHLLLVMLAPPLLLIANPLPFILWGLPEGIRRWADRLLARRSPFRGLLQAVASPAIAWLLFVGFYIGWHDPNLYDAALRYGWVHDLEHLTFFGSAMLVWWHISGAGPRLHGKFTRGARVAYALSFVPPNMLTGIVIAFSQAPLYPHYTTVPRLWGITVLQDQQWSGIVMWVPGSMMFIIAALVLLYLMFQADANQPPLRESDWAADKALIAPGMEK